MRSRMLAFGPIPLLAVSALIATACGPAAGSGVASLEQTELTVEADDGGAPTEDDVEAALLEFAECMREHGVDMEDPTVDADGNVQFGRFRDGQGEPGTEEFDREAVREAREACGELLDTVTLGFRGEPDEDFQDTLLEYAECIRDNGYDMDDPDFSGGDGTGPGTGPFGAIDREDPAFQAAQEACSDILGGQGLRGPGGGGPGGGPDE